MANKKLAELSHYNIAQGREGVVILGVGNYTSLSLAGILFGKGATINTITAPGVTNKTSLYTPAELDGLWLPCGGSPITQVDVATGVAIGVIEPEGA